MRPPDLTDRNQPVSFGITPVIDIVFLLIIFFLLVCRFMEAENFEVSVPDGCHFAETSGDDAASAPVTVTVIPAEGGQSIFAVGPETVDASGNYREMATALTAGIDRRMKSSGQKRKVVTLRIDRDVEFKEFQYALLAVAQSRATEVKLAVIKPDRQ